jgi:hypothetical protein
MPWKNPNIYRLDWSNVVKHAPPSGGVYGIFAETGWVYFGETADLQRRLSEHLRDRGHCIHDYQPLHFSFEVTPERSLRCHELVIEFSPPCNLGAR